MSDIHDGMWASIYAGKWYSNLLGKPEELAFILKETDSVLSKFQFLYLTKKYVAITEKAIARKFLARPLKGYEIDRPKQMLMIKIFNKLEKNRTFF